jgi:hypothetical protein
MRKIKWREFTLLKKVHDIIKPPSLSYNLITYYQLSLNNLTT